MNHEPTRLTGIVCLLAGLTFAYMAHVEHDAGRIVSIILAIIYFAVGTFEWMVACDRISKDDK